MELTRVLLTTLAITMAIAGIWCLRRAVRATPAARTTPARATPADGTTGRRGRPRLAATGTIVACLALALLANLVEPAAAAVPVCAASACAPKPAPHPPAGNSMGQRAQHTIDIHQLGHNIDPGFLRPNPGNVDNGFTRPSPVHATNCGGQHLITCFPGHILGGKGGQGSQGGHGQQGGHQGARPGNSPTSQATGNGARKTTTPHRATGTKPTHTRPAGRHPGTVTRSGSGSHTPHGGLQRPAARKQAGAHGAGQHHPMRGTKTAGHAHGQGGHSTTRSGHHGTGQHPKAATKTAGHAPSHGGHSAGTVSTTRSGHHSTGQHPKAATKTAGHTHGHTHGQGSARPSGHGHRTNPGHVQGSGHNNHGHSNHNHQGNRGGHGSGTQGTGGQGGSPKKGHGRHTQGHDYSQYDFTTPPGKAIFWSGDTDGVNSQDVADDLAAKTGSTTVDQFLKEHGIPQPAPGDIEAWKQISQLFAQGASGVVRVVLGKNRRPGSIWDEIEFPALKNNPNVTKIIAIDPKTGEMTIIWTR